MKTKFLLSALVALLSLGSVQTSASAGADNGRRSLFDFGWRFYQGDNNAAKSVEFNDSKWRALDLPHDWSIEGTVDKANPVGNDGGYYPAGTAWYRKTFALSSAMKNKKLWLYFEGVYEKSDVYVNGIRVGGHPYGYTSFFCDITAQAKPGKKNVVAVRVNNSEQKNCRWYSGSGIYRHVWLVAANPVHVANYGVYVTTPSANEAQVSTTIVNETNAAKRITVKVNIPLQGTAKTELNVPADSSVQVSQRFKLTDAKLWSVESPNLYNADVEIISNGKTIDRVSQPFGVRTVEYSAADGFRLNGVKMKLNGCCVHHDNGILGAASYDRAEERKVELMKAAGFNAIRTSHNLPSEAFLTACDRLGMLVIDEAFDGWRDAKNKFDYSTLFDEWWHADVTAMALRDRNHPSIFCWSIGNEVIERKKIEVVTTAHKLAAAIKECDPTRPVTSALAAWDKNWEIYDPLAAELDIVGYNYMIHKAPDDHKRVPERVMMQTESYPRDAFKNWEMMTDNEYVIGDFVWTGLDYLGESGIGRYWYEGETPGEHYQRPLYPWHGSYCGDVDVIGWRKPISHYRSIINGTAEKMYMAVKEPDGYRGKISTGLWAVWPTWESWNWQGHEGKPIEVEIYSTYPAVRLYLDNRMIGEQSTGRKEQFKAVFSLPYAAGTLRAEAIDNGKVVETKTLKTAGKPAIIRAVADRNVIAADGQDLSYVTIEVTDADGNVVPEADNQLSFSVSGAGDIEAVGSANMQDTTSYKAHSFKAWKGRALVVVKSRRNKAGNITLNVTSPGLKQSAVKIQTRK